MRARGIAAIAATLAFCFGASAPGAESQASDLPELRGEAKARIQNIEQHLDEWDVAGAASELAELEKVAPPGVQPVRYFRGRVAFEQGRYEEAVAELEASGIRDRPGSWIQLARETRQLVANHVRFESEHFVLLVPRGTDELLAPWALEALEKARRGLEAELGSAPPERVRVEVVSNAGELSKMSTLTREAIKTTGTIAICKFNKLIITSPRAVLRGYDWLDTLAHEYTHFVVSKKSRNTVPIWLHEGLAKYLESRWRDRAGLSLSPASLALLGSRVRAKTLVPFEKMHPSMALLPTAEDAATAFAEVFFAVKLIHEFGGPDSLGRLLKAMAHGGDDKSAIESVTKKRWPDFERAWTELLKSQPYPKELIAPAVHERRRLAENDLQNKPGAPAQRLDQGREISFGDFTEVSETDVRRLAHLGELFRERRRMRAAAEQYERAWTRVGNRYESISNKYALTLSEIGRLDEATRVLEGSLSTHPGSAQTNVHLARVALKRGDHERARRASLDALAVDPFDPEIHLNLYRSSVLLGDPPLKERSTTALALLLGIDRARVPETVATLLQRNALVGHEPTPDGGVSRAVAVPDGG
jgi:tetratricopeptide (TPR) repeat protein